MNFFLNEEDIKMFCFGRLGHLGSYGWKKFVSLVIANASSYSKLVKLLQGKSTYDQLISQLIFCWDFVLQPVLVWQIIWSKSCNCLSYTGVVSAVVNYFVIFNLISWNAQKWEKMPFLPPLSWRMRNLVNFQLRNMDNIG